MNLFNHINISNEDSNFAGNGIHVPEGCWINLKRFFATDISIVDLKQQEGENPLFSFCFRGTLEMKIGLARPGYSFTWLCERKLSSRDWCLAEIPLDLGSFTNGTLEISFLGIEESALSFELPHIAPQEITPQNILYDFISPTLDLCCEEQIYYKFLGSNIYYSFEDACVHMGKETSLDLLTYFNAFSACKWAKYTNIENLSAYIDFTGIADIIIVHKDEFGEHKICGYSIETTQRQTFELPIGKYPKTGLLGIRIFAHQKSILFGGGWLSPDSATQPVHLGIGITTFKREDAVKAAVHRLAKAIAAHPLYHDSIDITVVDNGKTLTAEDVPGALLIPNENLGGTGGFMRNLLHYKDSDKFTHCLFMDDDASCEAESIFRSISFMKHAKDSSLAISGAMLSENIKFIQWENGAWFDKCCHPLHCNYDLRDSDILLANEKEDAPEPTYGAWWFFMFPIRQVSMYSFPFFVRGDDIEFSYTNKFKIARMNGIATWQEDFKIKESPMTLYLDVRSHVLHHLVLEHIDHGPWDILKMVWAFFHRFNWAYQYDTANAIAMSFSDMLEGPKYWLDNMDTGKIRAKIKEKYTMEASRPLRDDYRDVPEALENVRLPFCTKFIRRVSLNGHLLPRCMVHRGISRLNKYQVPFINRVFLRDEVLVCNEINNTEMVLKHNRGYFIKNIFSMIKNSIIFIKNYRKIKSEYRIFLTSLESDKFWREIFDI